MFNEPTRIHKKNMKIKSIKVIKGKNKWSDSKDKLIHMVLDLGEYEQKPSNKIDGFYQRIKKYLPSMQSHRCSIGRAGGFFKRVKEGTWMGHIIEHVALELQTLAGYDTGWGRTRGVKGQKGVYNVVFNYVNEDKGKLVAKEAFNVVNDIINDRDPQIDKIVKKLKSKPLQESIRRIMREETYSPAGNEYTPGRYVVHKSAPYWRENIELTGLQVSVGDCYQIYVGGDVKCKKSIFATDSLNEKDMFDSTYDDDIWLIDTECASVSWFKDKHFDGGDYNYHIVTFENISPNCLELIHKGTGKSW